MEKKRVLAVDDEEDFTKLIKLNLEETGRYEVLTLSDAKDVIAKVHGFKPDVILLDLLMPKIDGIDVCEMLNNDAIGKKVPVIVLSALSKYEDKRIAFKAGVVDYLEKPIEKDALIVKIERVLQSRSS